MRSWRALIACLVAYYAVMAAFGPFPRQPMVPAWPVTHAPAPRQGRYALSTIVMTDGYVPAALQWCESLGRRRGNATFVVAFVTEDVREAGRLRGCCFDEVRTVEKVNVPGLHAEPRLSSQLTKIAVMGAASADFDRVLLMDSDTTVVNATALEELVATPMRFGAVQSTTSNGWIDVYNGGLFVFEPDEGAAQEMLDVAVRDKLDDQKIVYRFFHERPGTVVLPERFNVLMGRERETVRMWRELADDAVVFHFIVGKPWNLPTAPFPYSLWHENLARVSERCGYRPVIRNGPREWVDALGVYIEWVLHRPYRLS